MTNLSPAAQAVWTAAWDDCPVQIGNTEGTRRKQIAAALRAAADQVVPEHVNLVGDGHDEARHDQWMRLRFKLLAIAIELETAND